VQYDLAHRLVSQPPLTYPVLHPSPNSSSFLRAFSPLPPFLGCALGKPKQLLNVGVAVLSCHPTGMQGKLQSCLAASRRCRPRGQLGSAGRPAQAVFRTTKCSPPPCRQQSGLLVSPGECEACGSPPWSSMERQNVCVVPLHRRKLFQ